MKALASLSTEIKQYLIITGNYWAFTLTDGALRMLVVLYFHQLGYSPLAIAMLFLFYEFFGVVTNLLGGWLGARVGLNRTMNIGLALQIVSLAMLLVPMAYLTVAWVMAAQALSGVAKDLNKMSAKSAIKALLPKNAEHKLFTWVAALTGSKNALKGIGFFLGGASLSWVGFSNTILIMAASLTVVWLCSIKLLKSEIGKSSSKPKFTEILSKSSAVNWLSAARLFLFGARDVWFVVALPVFLSATLGWSHESVGVFFATWIIGYGAIQSQAQRIIGLTPTGKAAVIWCAILTVLTLLLTAAVYSDYQLQITIVVGLLIFGAVFAINSSLHSYLIVHYANSDRVSMDVGFYYMANAMGRLLGTVLSGVLYQQSGFIACLAASAAFLFLSTIFSLKLDR
jgi:predicted MFS family arabinose efflux permease